MLNSVRAVAIAALTCLSAAPALAKPPVEVFSENPPVRSASLSPDGSKMVYIGRVGESEYLTVFDFATGEIQPLVSTTSIRAQSAQFVGDNYALLIASDDVKMQYFSGRHERSAAFVYNLKTKKMVQLLVATDGIYPGQTSLGRIIAIDPDGKHVYMPVWMGAVGNDPSYDVLKVNLDTGKSVRGSTILGEKNTIDWLVSANGQPIAREDFDEDKRIHTISVYDNGKARKIFEKKVDLLSESLVGATKDGDVIIASGGDTEFVGLYAISRKDGSRTPLGSREDADVSAVLLDPDDRTSIGVIYGGMTASYDMVDKALDADIDAVVSAIPTATTYIASWTKDRSQLLVLVEGGTRAERYMLFNRATKKLSLVTNARPDVKSEDVGEVTTIEYKARDGLKIPAIVTWPTGVPKEQRKNLPMVVMPHGGPESYDTVSYDWLAQFVANEGYVVLQPNFRGSDGFGVAFRDAGRKQWGRKTQDDITDGAKALIAMGWADPARVCIVGWSYGGYAALAGGALTPDMYKCVVSIAGVSDLRDMMGDELRIHGKDSQTYMYWKRVIGDPDSDGEALEAVSPARHAGNFKAPVLLVHGSEDQTVPARQSDKMESALKNADKEVHYLRLRNDDHGLVNKDSRRQMLTWVADFLKKNIGGPS